MLFEMVLWSLPLAALVFLGGWFIRRTWPGPEKKSYYTFYLTAVVILLPIIVAASFLIPSPVGPPLGFRMVIISAPVILGILAVLALHLRRLWTPTRRDILVVLVLIGIAIPASRLPWSGDLLGLLTGMLVLALLLWVIPRRGAGFLLLLVLACLAYLYIANNVIQPALIVGNLWPVLSYTVLPLLAIVPATLIHRAIRPQLDPGPPVATGLRLVYLALAVLLLGYFAYSVFWASVWDHTSDGLGGVFYLLHGSIAAVAAGFVLVYLLPDRRRIAGVAFAVLVPVLLNQAFQHGWQVSYRQLTEDRAAQIEAALEHYRADHGHYPQELEALSPDYLWRVPGPVILRTVGWCYRAGEDHYRLGTFYREYFSLPIFFRLYAQAGDPPDEWACQEMHDEVMERYGGM
jgi:hypothetical protein